MQLVLSAEQFEYLRLEFDVHNKNVSPLLNYVPAILRYWFKLWTPTKHLVDKFKSVTSRQYNRSSDNLKVVNVKC